MSDDDDNFDDIEDDEIDDDDLDDEEDEGGGILRMLAYAVPILLVIVLVGFIGLSVGGKKSAVDLAPVKHASNSNEFNPLEEGDLSVPVPFGRKARNECALTCYSTSADRDLCLRGCNRFLVTDFARRISADEPEPDKLAREVTADCRTHSEKSERMQSADTWRAAVAEARRTLSEFRASVDLYESSNLLPRFTVLELIEKSLGRPEGLGKNADTFAANLQTQVCLREILVATQLAIVQTAAGRDLYSENFYRTLEKGLLVESSRLEDAMKDYAEKSL